MALNQFPYTNFHELNGDYVLQTVQQASADAQAAAQSAQAAAAGVAAANAKATEALSRSMEAGTKADNALVQSSSAQTAAQSAAQDAQTAQAQVATAQAAAQAAQTAASSAQQSASEASQDAAEAVQTARQALDAIPTVQTLTTAITEVPTRIAPSGQQSVAHLLNLAYPAALTFEQGSTPTVFRCVSSGFTVSQIIALIDQSINVDAVIVYGMSEGSTRQTRIKLSLAYCETANNSDYVRLYWMGFSPYTQNEQSAPFIWVLDAETTLNTQVNALTANMHLFNLTSLQVV